MNKETFYQTGFYSLIALIIGFFMGTAFETASTGSVDRVQIVHDTITTDSDSIVKSVKTAYVDTPSVHNVYAELQKQNVKHPKIVLAQSILETGHYQSNVCKTNNNLFGLMKGNDYHSFSHWKKSITYYKNHVQNRYKGGDYYAFLNNIGYAQDPDYINKLKELI